MTQVKPFRGYTYNREKFPDLSPVIAPPYDIVSQTMRRSLMKGSPHNIVRITVAEQDRKGIPDPDFYRKAGQVWNSWRQSRVLSQAGEPAVWRLRETFTSLAGGRLTREGFLAKLRLQELGSGDILRHEGTRAEPKADRTMLMETTLANLSPVFFVYRDHSRETEALCNQFVGKTEVHGTMISDGDVRFELSMTTERSWIQQFQSYLKNASVLIADGHHRYEASLSFDRRYRQKAELDTSHILGYFVPASSDGLIVYPTHRGIRPLPDLDKDAFVRNLRRYFTFADKQDATNLPTLRLFTPDLGTLFLAPRPGALAKNVEDWGGSLSEAPDVVILEEIILKKILGLSSSDASGMRKIVYFRDEDSCKEAVQEGTIQMAFFLAPIPIDELFSLAAKGRILPPKSTYFYPKCPTGLVMRSMEIE